MSLQLRKIYKFFLFSVLLLLLLILSSYFLINFFISKEDIKKYIISFTSSYLDRKIDFNSIDINLLKGIVLKDLTVSPITSLSNSVSFNIKEIDLKYNYKALFHFKILISSIIIKNLNIKLNDKILKDEISYYKNKFANTNKKSTKTNKKNFLYLTSLQLNDSTIIYNNYKFNINSINLNNNGKLISLKNNFELFFKNKKVKVNGSIYTFNKIININENIDYNKYYSKIKIISYALTNIKINSSIFHNKKYISTINGSISYSTNKIAIQHIIISDKSKNSIQLKNCLFYIKKLLFKGNIYLKMFSFQKNSSFFNISDSIKFPDFNSSLNGNLFLILNIKNPKNSIIKKGKIKLEKFYLSISTNNKLHLFNSKFSIKNNKLIANLPAIIFNKMNFYGNSSIKNVFSPYKISVNIFSKRINLKSYIKKELLLDDVSISSFFNLKNNLVHFNSIQCRLNKSKINSTGNLYISTNDSYTNQFKINISGIGLNDIDNLINISTNTLPIKTKFNNLTYIKFTLKNGFKIRDFTGSISGKFEYDKINGKLHTKYTLINDYLHLNSANINTLHTQILIKGGYNLKNNSIHLTGKSSINLRYIPYLKNSSGIANLKFSLEKSSILNSELSLSSKFLTLYSLDFNNINSHIILKNKKIYGYLNAKRFYNGQIYSTITNFNSLKIYTRGKNIDIAKLTKKFITGNISGTLNFNSLLIKEDSNLSGNIKFQCKKGEIENTEYQKKLGGFLNLIDSLEDIFYDLIEGEITLTSKKIKIKKLQIICPDQRYSAKGFYNIQNNTMNINVAPAFSETFVENVPNFALQIIKKKNGWYYIKNVIIKKKNNKFIYSWEK